MLLTSACIMSNCIWASSSSRMSPYDQGMIGSPKKTSLVYSSQVRPRSYSSLTSAVETGITVHPQLAVLAEIEQLKSDFKKQLELVALDKQRLKAEAELNKQLKERNNLLIEQLQKQNEELQEMRKARLSTEEKIQRLEEEQKKTLEEMKREIQGQKEKQRELEEKLERSGEQCRTLREEVQILKKNQEKESRIQSLSDGKTQELTEKSRSQGTKDMKEQSGFFQPEVSEQSLARLEEAKKVYAQRRESFAQAQEHLLREQERYKRTKELQMVIAQSQVELMQLNGMSEPMKIQMTPNSSTQMYSDTPFTTIQPSYSDNEKKEALSESARSDESKSLMNIVTQSVTSHSALTSPTLGVSLLEKPVIPLSPSSVPMLITSTIPSRSQPQYISTSSPCPVPVSSIPPFMSDSVPPPLAHLNTFGLSSTFSMQQE